MSTDEAPIGYTVPINTGYVEDPEDDSEE